MAPSSDKKLILVLGATGAQGLAVVDALLAPAADGSASPYAVRALTRDPGSRRAQELAAKGVECVQGSFMDFDSVLEALRGVYGAWINTDGFTVGEQKEVYAGIRIFEIAKQLGTVRHYVWSSLDYATKKGGNNPDYRVGHFDGKGRVADWLKAQPSAAGDDDGMTWSIVTSAPYMNMLNHITFGPLTRRADGTFVFATPIGTGHVPMIALSDLGFFARYAFDHRAAVAGRDLEVASALVGWDELVATFARVTGQRAVVLHQTLDEWFANLTNVDRPVANELREADGSMTWRENFSGWWRIFRDDVISRDMDWIRSLNPNGHTLESWMRETGYTGVLTPGLLKNSEDGKSVGVDWERVRSL